MDWRALWGAALVCLALPLSGCDRKAPEPVVLGTDRAALEREGLKSQPEAWEDGARKGEEEAGFEWWYFDGQTSEGLYVVLVYYRSFDSFGPFVSLRLTLPDGRRISFDEAAPPEQCAFSRDGFDVKLGKSWARGDLHRYLLHMESADGRTRADLTLESRSRPWRPGSGFWRFGAERQRYYAWLVGVPYGRVEGTLEVDGRRLAVSGTGYHDHNWGNLSLPDAWNHWWWVHTHLDGVTVVGAQVVASEAYGFRQFPILTVQDEDGVSIDDETARVTLGEPETHPRSGKPVVRTLTFAGNEGEYAAKLSLRRREDLTVFDMLDSQPWWKATLARLLGIRPWYYQFDADAELTLSGGGADAVHRGRVIFEYMDLGADPHERRSVR